MKNLYEKRGKEKDVYALHSRSVLFISNFVFIRFDVVHVRQLCLLLPLHAKIFYNEKTELQFNFIYMRIAHLKLSCLRSFAS